MPSLMLSPKVEACDVIVVEARVASRCHPCSRFASAVLRESPQLTRYERPNLSLTIQTNSAS